jgi:hypothetical protein
VGRIVFLHGQFGARARLGAALAGDPGLVAGRARPSGSTLRTRQHSLRISTLS